MNEKNILDDLQQAALALHIPPAIDLQTTLPRHATHRWRTRNVEAIKGLVWHQELAWSSVEDVAKYHTGPMSHLKEGGVASISYTWAIRRDGQIVLCLPFHEKPWSQGDRHRPGDENAEFMSVMMEGMFDGPGVVNPDSGEPTQEQLLSALMLWRVCAVAWNWDQDDLYGHYHFGKPSCPGFTTQAVIEAFRQCSVDSIKDVESPVFNASDPEHDIDFFDLTSALGRQKALIKLGHLAGAADGVWGMMSKGALVAFQQAVGLVADGVWGKKTERAMTKALTPPKKEYDLTTLIGRQEALIVLDILDGKADGVWGKLSEQALVRFQGRMGLAPDGVWGAMTQQAIVKELAK